VNEFDLCAIPWLVLCVYCKRIPYGTEDHGLFVWFEPEAYLTVGCLAIFTKPQINYLTLTNFAHWQWCFLRNFTPGAPVSGIKQAAIQISTRSRGPGRSGTGASAGGNALPLIIRGFKRSGTGGGASLNVKPGSAGAGGQAWNQIEPDFGGLGHRHLCTGPTWLWARLGARLVTQFSKASVLHRRSILLLHT